MTMQIIKSGDILIQDFVQKGSDISSKAGNHTMVLLKTKGGDVVIKNCEFLASGYNCIEGDPSTANPYTVHNVTIENCVFQGPLSNNAISFYNIEDGAAINIKNCRFGQVSNAVRISNNLVSNITINVEDCVVEHGESGNYRGFFLFQNYKGEDTQFRNITINFKNCVYTDNDGVTTDTSLLGEGDVVTHTVGADNANQMVYVYSNTHGLLDDASYYPTVNIIK